MTSVNELVRVKIGHVGVGLEDLLDHADFVSSGRINLSINVPFLVTALFVLVTPSTVSAELLAGFPVELVVFTPIVVVGVVVPIGIRIRLVLVGLVFLWFV